MPVTHTVEYHQSGNSGHIIVAVLNLYCISSVDDNVPLNNWVNQSETRSTLDSFIIQQLHEDLKSYLFQNLIFPLDFGSLYL